MNKVFSKLKKHWITVWLVVAVLAVGVFVAVAAYTGIYSVKRVVSMKPSAGMLFSSNSMQPYTSESSITTRHLTTSQGNGSYIYNLTVCDFAQSDPLTRYVSEHGLAYTLTAQLCVKINNAYYPVNDTTNVSNDIRSDAANRQFKIQYVSDGGTNVSTDQPHSLSTGAEYTYSAQLIRPQQTGSVLPNGTNKYAITFDEYELGDNQTIDYFVKVMATPTDGLLEPIACYLYVTRSIAQDSAWAGSLKENSGWAGYDAYNYIVEGSGTGTVTIRWNSSFIDVSEIFLAQNNLINSVVTEPAAANGNIWKYFELEVGNAVNGTVIGRYEIQLFKNNENGDYSNVPNYISCTYVAD